MTTGLVTPDYGQMGTENLPSGNGAAYPYGSAEQTSSAPAMSTGTMQVGQDPAKVDIGYSRYIPRVGFADRLAANIPSGGGSFISGSYYNGRGSNV